MPRLAINYSKTLIYKIVHQDDYENRNIYIGHTTDFIKRKNAHKTSCNKINSKDHNLKKYQYIRDNGGWDTFKMVEIEKYPCKDKREASAREEYWRDAFKANLNDRRCFITPEQKAEYAKQYQQDNADKILQYYKQWRQDNLDKMTEYDKQYRQDNADKIKQYYQDNTDKIIEKSKQYQKNNADKISEQRKERVVCECCGLSSRKTDLKKHQRTAKCLKAKEAL